MTTASRPTWNAAMGSEDRGGSLRGVASRQISSKDAPGQTKLHYRQEGQNAPTELSKKDFKAELEERERKAKEKRPFESEPDLERFAKRLRLESGDKKESSARALHPEDKDDSDSSGHDSDSDDNSDDETAELMRELERIQKERADESKRQEKQRAQADLTLKAESAMFGNPLLAEKDDFKVKKKWYEDTVFRNQTRTAPAPKKARFINDTIRNDFHKKFLYKYVK